MTHYTLVTSQKASGLFYSTKASAQRVAENCNLLVVQFNYAKDDFVSTQWITGMLFLTFVFVASMNNDYF